MVKKSKNKGFNILDTIMRVCSFNGCNYPVFGTDKNTGKGYCRSHQYLRGDLKKIVKRNTVKSRNEKLSRNKKGFDPFQWDFTNEFELFKHIWENRVHKSAISGRNLDYFNDIGIERWVGCFAHVLSKKNFPLYRYNPNNIMLMHPFEHYLLDHGKVSERISYIELYPESDFELFFEKMELLKTEYSKI